MVPFEARNVSRSFARSAPVAWASSTRPSIRERNERVALKTLREFDALGLNRFKQEFRSLSEILHPQLIPLYELVGEGDQWFFTMELVERATNLLAALRGQMADDPTPDPSTNAPTLAGGPLSDTRTDSLEGAGREAPPSTPAPLSPRASAPVEYGRIRQVFRKLAEGVSALHDAGKLHRDLKPSNVLVDADGRVVILDFGLVANLSDAAPDAGVAPSGLPISRQVYQSTDRSLTGTIAFMSPEQAARESLTPASDWSLVRRHAVSGTDRPAAVRRHGHRSPGPQTAGGASRPVAPGDRYPRRSRSAVRCPHAARSRTPAWRRGDSLGAGHIR